MRYAVFAAFGALAEALTGAWLVLQGQPQSEMFHIFAAYSRFGLFFTLLGLANSPLQRTFAICLIGLAWTWTAFPPIAVALSVVAVITFNLVLMGQTLLREPSWSERQRMLLVVIGGFIIFDLFFDLPFLLAPSQDRLQLTYFNNTVHNYTAVHEVWLMIAMFAALACIVRGIIRDRRVLDYVLLGLFVAGGVMLWIIVEPSEQALGIIQPTDASAAGLLRTIGYGHAGSLLLIIVRLVLSAPGAAPPQRTQNKYPS